eukprot:14171-Heterococcus_DN1.PRE.3
MSPLRNEQLHCGNVFAKAARRSAKARVCSLHGGVTCWIHCRMSMLPFAAALLTTSSSCQRQPQDRSHMSSGSEIGPFKLELACQCQLQSGFSHDCQYASIESEELDWVVLLCAVIA